jgi:hypothetical protein
MGEDERNALGLEEVVEPVPAAGGLDHGGVGLAVPAEVAGEGESVCRHAGFIDDAARASSVVMAQVRLCRSIPE